MIPLSFAQQRLWFLHRLDGPSATYNIPICLRLAGRVDDNALEQALCDAVVRHESLRTIFPDTDDLPQQVVLPAESTRPTMEVLDASEAALAAQLDRAAGHCFEIASEIPIRAWLFHLGADQHVLLLLCHHIASDGWSAAPLARDLRTAYAARLQGNAPTWAALPVQYADYTLWQRELLGDELDPDSTSARQLAYWQRTLADLPEQLQLPTDRPRPVASSYHGEHLPILIDTPIHQKLAVLARESQTSLFMVLQAALATLFTRMGAGTDIALGSAIAGRTDEALNDLIGFFVNTLVLRTDTSGNPSFRELLARVRETNLSAYEHQDLPFERLVEVLNPVRSMARHPLFQVSLVFQNNARTLFALQDLEVSAQPLGRSTAKFDLSFTLWEQFDKQGKAQGIAGRIEFATDLFDRPTIEQLSARLQRVLEVIAVDPSQPIDHIEILQPGERARILLDWNDTAHPVPEALLPALFEQQVARAPDAIALVFEDTTLTYGELNARANQLAHHLIAQGVGPESLVALALPRSLEMVISLLAILKAGGAYLPLDVDYPKDRLAFMLEDASPICMISDSATARLLPPGVPTLCLDDTSLTALLAAAPLANPTDHDRVRPLRPANPAYVIYTSGSTGRPKGVVVSHAGVSSLSASQVQHLNLHRGSRVLQFASLSFDAAFWEVVQALLSGAALVLARAHDLLPGDALAATVSKHRVTHLTIPPIALAAQESGGLPGDLNLVIAGESGTAQLIEKWSHGRQLINAYGPTEATVCATMSAPLFGLENPPIGHPISNTQVYVLDAALQPVPAGVPGELYIA
ncbi:condensation domain-containing protein, partial [Variovorax sp. EL159]|uniref:non-ribosomal peptide synthetase n=1 Tax=Variovorax sp. EL159 TaxID=1566270 RepID=UPI00088959CE